ncbi:hypothetical protein [Novosphingobium arvoryzae]|uniref:Uncharacterized protein n=1 Tax=Novosphingobium arvoryzae TaxID=1256514 RepID=A0A918R9M0_9SPHN|nr:hypothetical protein [Novosphingobium arvoryzae]GGZ90467.1 hypothetical protein GCM10011617_06750 [Novosphingobium arvoryzae]
MKKMIRATSATLALFAVNWPLLLSADSTVNLSYAQGSAVQPSRTDYPRAAATTKAAVSVQKIYQDNIYTAYLLISEATEKVLADGSINRVVLANFAKKGIGHGGEQEPVSSMLVSVVINCSGRTVTWASLTAFDEPNAKGAKYLGRLGLYDGRLRVVDAVNDGNGGINQAIFNNVCRKEDVSPENRDSIAIFFKSDPIARSLNVPDSSLSRLVETYRDFGILNTVDLKAAVERMRLSGQIPPSDPKELYFGSLYDGAVVTFLRDEVEARRTGRAVQDIRKERLATIDRQKQERQRQDAADAAARKVEQVRIAREYPFVAVISCGLTGWENINTLACFAGSNSGAATELEINNGGSYRLYKPHEIAGNFPQQGRGIEIPLRTAYSIKIQNSNRNLKLGLRIFDRAGNVVFEKQASQYGVIMASR